jgi:hypothetical protein
VNTCLLLFYIPQLDLARQRPYRTTGTDAKRLDVFTPTPSKEGPPAPKLWLDGGWMVDGSDDDDDDDNIKL